MAGNIKTGAYIKKYGTMLLLLISVFSVISGIVIEINDKINISFNMISSNFPDWHSALNKAVWISNYIIPILFFVAMLFLNITSVPIKAVLVYEVVFHAFCIYYTFSIPYLPQWIDLIESCLLSVMAIIINTLMVVNNGRFNTILKTINLIWICFFVRIIILHINSDLPCVINSTIISYFLLFIAKQYIVSTNSENSLSSEKISD